MGTGSTSGIARGSGWYDSSGWFCGSLPWDTPTEPSRHRHRQYRNFVASMFHNRSWRFFMCSVHYYLKTRWAHSSMNCCFMTHCSRFAKSFYWKLQAFAGELLTLIINTKILSLGFYTIRFYFLICVRMVWARMSILELYIYTHTHTKHTHTHTYIYISIYIMY
jgi:hypothetical protein